MDNSAIVIEHTFTEQHIHDDNQQHEKFTQNQSNSARPDNIIEIKKTNPMNPTPLYISSYKFQS